MIVGTKVVIKSDESVIYYLVMSLYIAAIDRSMDYWKRYKELYKNNN